MEHREQHERYRQDRETLAAIGAHLGRQVPRLTVRLPRSWDGEEVVVDLDVVQIAASVRAAR